MGFDWKAFAAAFLDKQTEGIIERKDEAKEYEEEQEELAKANRKIIADRTLLASEYGQLGKKAMELGATKEQVMAAMGSGALGIKTFYDKLIAAANQKGISTLGPSDVEAIIDMPEVFEVNPDYIDMNLNELAQIQYGAKMKPGTRPADVQTSDSVLATLFGVNAMDQAKQKLQDTKAVGGMSIADINELAAQAEYNSLFPNLGVNFFDKEFYGPEAASQFLKDLVEIEADATVGAAAEKRIENAGLQWRDKMKTENPNEQTAAWIAEQKRLERTMLDAEQDMRELITAETAAAVIEGAIGTYGETGLFDHEPSVNIMRRIMGDDWVNKEIELIKNFRQPEQPEETQPEPSNEQPPNTEQNQEEQTQETTETETSNTTNQETQIPTEESPQELTMEEKKEALLAKTFPTRASQRGLASKGIWDRKYEGKVDEQGKIIIAPSRPPEGGAKTKEIPITTGLFNSPTGKKKKVTEAEYWDATYGETHDPATGLPLGIDELLED